MSDTGPHAATQPYPIDWGRVSYLVMAGGQGSRLWPLSRHARPKQFLDLVGDGATMLQRAASWRPRAVPLARTFVNVAPHLAAQVTQQLPELPADNVIAVPDNRETLPTLVYAASAIARRTLGCTLLIVASDTIVADVCALQTCFEAMVASAQMGPHLVSLGTQPTFPSTSYGYMRRGAPVPGAPGAFYGRGYTEKPSADVARQLIAQGDADWNTGMFAWQIDIFQSACRLYSPEHGRIFRGLIDASDQAARHSLFFELPRADLDRGLLERIPEDSGDIRQIFVSGRLGWSDLGSFEALASYLAQDAQNNCLRGTVASDTMTHSMAINHGAGGLEVQDVDHVLIVLNEAGDLLVADRCRAAQIGQLKAAGQAVDATPANSVQSDGTVYFTDAQRVDVHHHGRGTVAILGVSDVEITLIGHDAVVAGTTRASAPPAPAVARNAIVLPSPLHVAEHVAAQLVRDLHVLLARHRCVRIALSSGASPGPTYQLLTRIYAHAVDWRRVLLVQMDEYASTPGDDPRAFRHFLQHALVGPLGMQARYLTGDETTEQMQHHEAQLLASGGLHLVLHGVGRNGHLAFNEPGTAFEATAGRVKLAAQTRAAALPAFGATPPTHGVTFGLGLLNRSPMVRVVATGAHKRSAVRRGLCRPPSAASPLSSLQGHPDCTFFLDDAACPWATGA